MFSLDSTHRYFLYNEHCDMRKGFDALSGLVRSKLGKNPAGGDVFLFLNRRRNLLKLLHWEPGGFVLYYKRLEQGTFRPPAVDIRTGAITWADLVLMVEDYRVSKSRRQVHFYG